ncbi:MAG: hypothetical protein O7A65_09235 [Proteobacteria bacterium]|nr:hypothetical protein [Pseudomonadota bacterium]
MIGKILVLAAIIVIVLFGYKMIARLKGANPSSRVKDSSGTDSSDTDLSDSESSGRIEGEEMITCAVCGSYVSAERPGSCGRGDCPY